MQRGFIKIWRKIEDWEWYSDWEMIGFFVYLIISANHKDSYYQGHLIPRGSLVCGRKALAKETGQTEQQIRLKLKKLKISKNITIKTTNRFSIISIDNYEIYQENKTIKTTNREPTENQQRTTSKELKNIRKESNSGFETFWKVYPKKVSKTTALRSFNTINPNTELLQKIVAAIGVQSVSEQWTKDNGKFIPHPATWLNQQRWEDEITSNGGHHFKTKPFPVNEYFA